MKKIFLILCVSTLILTGCGDKKEETKPVDKNNILTCDFEEESRKINTVFTFDEELISKIDVVMTFYDEDMAKAFYELIKSQGLNYGTLDGKVITKEITGDAIVKEIGLLTKKDEIKTHYEQSGYICK